MIRTKTGIPVATDSIRTVHGGRGDYLEFSREQMVMDNLNPVIGWCPHHRTTHAYFWEYRTADNVMVYEQRETVKYADYKIGLFYISPKDVMCDAA
jgi:hypothetical protein